VSAAAERRLAGRVCVVAGASRGVGRGIALGLGEAGATVICAARSTRFGPRTEGRQETVEDTAEAVEAVGGQGWPYVCDLTDTRALHDFAAWTLRRFGPPDCVVCAVWGGNEGYDGEHYADGSRFGTPFFQRSLAPVETALRTGPLATLAVARAFVPLMMQARHGLIVSVGFDGEGRYLGDIAYDLGKAAIHRASEIMAIEVAPHGLACLHLTPGFVRTERVIDAGMGEAATQSPLYAGRAVAALLADPDVATRNGQSLFVADLARHYGFTDADGTQPPRFDPAADPPGADR
jgi:NAD(P)-dependent dehydrogenase (short-subunit alcohol dehydrogenase family)